MKSNTINWVAKEVHNLMPGKQDSSWRVLLKGIAVITLIFIIFSLLPFVLGVVSFFLVREFPFESNRTKNYISIVVLLLGFILGLAFWGNTSKDRDVHDYSMETISNSPKEESTKEGISELLEETKTLIKEFNENLVVAQNYDISIDDYKEILNLEVKEGASETELQEIYDKVSVYNEELKSKILIAKEETYQVTKVVDGDTIKIMYNGIEESVRMIGIDTPETVHPTEAVECFGKEASDKMKEYVQGKNVKIMFDSSQGERDKYGRILLYVWVDDVFINKQMILEGYAYEYTYSTPYQYQSEFKEAQKGSQGSKKGLWGDVCACKEIELSRTCSSCNTATVTYQNWDCTKYKRTVQDTTCTVGCSTSTPSSACLYSCTSPDRDCADFSSHTQAVSFFKCCGFTAPNDPMKLDGTGIDDGDPCESLP